MERLFKDPVWKILGGYLLILFFILISSGAFAQIKVIQYNAEWNKENDVKWIDSLKNCKVNYICIMKNPKEQKKSEIIVVPTIIIYNKHKEVKRFQADISFTMKATREEVQEIIDEQYDDW